MSNASSNVSRRGFTLGDDPFDFEDPDYFEGCISKRIFGYIIDVIVLFLIGIGLWFITILTLGLLAPVTALVSAFIPLLYHTLMVSQRGATLGQQVMGLRVVDARTGANPTIVQAMILTVAFYISVAFWFLPLAYVLFDDKDRFLHDIVSSTRSLRADKFVDGTTA